MKQIYSQINQICVKNGLTLNEIETKYTPHLTLAKMSQIRNNRNNKQPYSKYFHTNIAKHVGCEKMKQQIEQLPSQTVSYVELCSLKSDNKSEDGYYSVVCPMPVINNLV